MESTLVVAMFSKATEMLRFEKSGEKGSSLWAYRVARCICELTLLAAAPDIGVMNGGKREGFRMPAWRERSTGVGAGVRKPPKNEPAGSGERLAVYGDLTGQRRRRGTPLPVWLTAECRQ